MKLFAERLKKLIEESRLTKYRLAKDLGCSKQSVCNWCDCISEPKLTYIKAIALYFDVSSDYLLGLEDESGAKVTTKDNFI